MCKPRRFFCTIECITLVPRREIRIHGRIVEARINGVGLRVKIGPRTYALKRGSGMDGYPFLSSEINGGCAAVRLIARRMR